jgi:hypothetical protein
MMSRLSFEPLKKSLTRLEEGFTDAARYPGLLTVRDGVIQRSGGAGVSLGMRSRRIFFSTPLLVTSPPNT